MVEQTQKQIIDDLSKVYSSKTHEIIRQIKAARSSITIVRYITGDGLHDVVIKIQHRSSEREDVSNRLAGEFDALVAAYRVFDKIDGLSVPEPIRNYPHLNAFAMSRCIGPSLTSAISGRKMMLPFVSRVGSARPLVQSCARWLRHFNNIESDDKNLDELVEFQRWWVDRKCRQLRERGEGVLDSRFVDGIVGGLTGGIDRLNWSVIETGRLHNDFGPHNILVVNDGICVLDIGDSETGFVMADACRFALEMATLAAVTRWPRVKRNLGGLSQVFHEEYGTNAPAIATRFFTLRAMITLILTMLAKRKNGEFAENWHRRAIPFYRSVVSG